MLYSQRSLEGHVTYPFSTATGEKQDSDAGTGLCVRKLALLVAGKSAKSSECAQARSRWTLHASADTARVVDGVKSGETSQFAGNGDGKVRQ